MTVTTSVFIRGSLFWRQLLEPRMNTDRQEG